MTENPAKTFAIIRGAPPPPAKCMGKANRFPWAELAISDAFDVPLSSDHRLRDYSRVSASMAQQNRKYPGRYVMRMMGERGTGAVVRCWRVA